MEISGGVLNRECRIQVGRDDYPLKEVVMVHGDEDRKGKGRRGCVMLCVMLQRTLVWRMMAKAANNV